MTSSHLAATRRTLTVATACGLVLALAACTGSSGNGASSEGPTQPATADVGPVTALFDGIYDASTDSREAAQHERRETLVVACMVDKGWEYTFRKVVQAERATVAEAPTGPQGKEYAEKYGYGMIGGQTSSEPSAAPHPNDVFVATLSDDERAAYEKDLWGYTAEEEAASEGAEAPDDGPTAAGCAGKADAEVGDLDTALEAVYNDPQHAELLASRKRFYTDADQAPSVLEAKADWASCMADEGIDGAPDPGALYLALQDQLSELFSDGDGEPDPSAVAEFKKQEIRTAVADHECQATVAYEEKRAKALFDAETGFYEAHRDALEGLAEALRTAMAGAGK